MAQFLLDFLTPEHILVGADFDDKWQAIDVMAELLMDKKSGVSHRDLADAVAL